MAAAGAPFAPPSRLRVGAGEAADVASAPPTSILVARVDQLARPPASGALRAERERLRHRPAAAAVRRRVSPADGQGPRAHRSAAQEVAGVTAFALELADVAAARRDRASHPGRVRGPAGHLAGLGRPARLEHVEARLEAFAQVERRYARRWGWSSRCRPKGAERLEAPPRSSPGWRPKRWRPPRPPDCAERLSAAPPRRPAVRARSGQLADLGMARGRLHSPSRAGRHRPRAPTVPCSSWRRPRRSRPGGRGDGLAAALAHRARDRVLRGPAGILPSTRSTPASAAARRARSLTSWPRSPTARSSSSSPTCPDRPRRRRAPRGRSP
jgi:hypothetical protein